jgi:hypothetical protein
MMPEWCRRRRACCARRWCSSLSERLVLDSALDEVFTVRTACGQSRSQPRGRGAGPWQRISWRMCRWGTCGGVAQAMGLGCIYPTVRGLGRWKRPVSAQRPPPHARTVPPGRRNEPLRSGYIYPTVRGLGRWKRLVSAQRPAPHARTVLPGRRNGCTLCTWLLVLVCG